MNWSKVICIEISKYNQVQLDVISQQLNLIDGLLYRMKQGGTTRVYWDTTKPFFIASLKKENLRDKYDIPLYKGLLMLNDDYRSMSRKEKDRLLKIKPTEFNTKKIKQIKSQQTSEPVLESEKIELPTEQLNYSVEDLSVDKILDKIIDFGFDSLTKAEKEFLDNQSKK